MAVPTRKQVDRNMRLRQMWKELNKKEKSESQQLTEEEHKKRLEMLKNIGIIKQQ
jgi:hypothetical protein